MDGECGKPSAFVLTDRNGNTWGACPDDLLPTMVLMAPNGPITADPISLHLPDVEKLLRMRPMPAIHHHSPVPTDTEEHKR